MEKDLIFFSEDGDGLTSTSANHIANMAKEMICGLEAEAEGMTLFSTSVALIGSDASNLLVKGTDDEGMRRISGILHKISDAKSLIAWLREAIKAKERLLRETRELTLEEFIKQENRQIPEEPKMARVLTEEDYYASLSLDERNRYYHLETLAAVLGKAIHPGGAFAESRKNLYDHIQRPHSVEGDGRDTLVYTYTPTVDTDAVEDVYFTLQKQYREAQAKLNQMKSECDRAVTESAVKAKTEYARAVKARAEAITSAEADKAAYVQTKTREISGYRIVVPGSLAEIYDEVSHLGKKGDRG